MDQRQWTDQGALRRRAQARPRPRTVLRHVLLRLLPAWLLLALVLATLLTLTAQLRQQARRLQHASAQMNAANQLRSDVLDMETGLRGYALTGEVQFLEPYRQATAVLDRDLAAMLRLGSQGPGASTAAAALDTASTLISEWRRQYVVPLLTARQPQQAAAALALSSTGKRLVDQVRVHLGTLEALGRAQAVGAELRIQALGAVWVPLLGALGVLALLLTLWALLRLSLELRQGLRALTDDTVSVPGWLRWRETDDVKMQVRAVQGQLQQERERRRLTGLTLDGVLNAMTAQLWAFDDAGQVRRVNRAGTRALHLPALPPGGERLDALWPALAGVLAAHPQGPGQPLPGEPQRLPTPDGDRWYLLTQERLEDGHLLVLTDVTQLEQSRRDLEAMNVNLSRSNTDLEHYAFVASHDLQEPLRTIASFAGLLLMTQQDRLDERGQLYARNVIEGAERLKRLIQDLLSFAKVRAEQMHFAPVDMRRVTEEVLLSLQDDITRRNSRVQVGPLPTVMGRESLLMQLLFNLLQNALKFSRDDLPGRVSLHGFVEGDVAHFTVQDNGIGIAPEYQEQVFVIFQRLHGRARYTGNGLGLAICRRITELHGGQLWVESQEGHGSHFHFTLPLATLPPPDPTGRAPT